MNSVIILLLMTLAVRANAGEVRAMRFDAKTPAEALKWQSAAREKLFALMMGGKRPDRVPLDPKIINHIDVPQGGYTLEEITIQTMPDRRAHAWVAMPRSPKGKVPAVLALHGHNASGEKALRRQMQFWYWYAPALAEMGYAVIAPDVGSHDLQHPDWSLMGERTWDAIRCIDYILSRPEVDPSGIAVCGLSLGGETTMYVAAMDERVKIADSAGWLTTIANTKNGHCPCWNFPGLEENFEFSDIFSCIAPRPLVCEIGRQEKAPGGFPVPFAETAFEEIRRAYRVFGKEDAAQLDIHPEGHVFSGRKFWVPLRKEMGTQPPWDGDDALRRGEIARRAFSRALGVLDGWWAKRDPETGLLPRRLDENVWEPKDNAADMLPFLYLTAHFLAPDRLPDITSVFLSEAALTNRVGVLPDWYDISKKHFAYPEVDSYRLVFGAAEYCKDGLIPMTEVMGRGRWTDRMLELLDGIYQQPLVKTDFGIIPADDTEVNGDILQAVCRVYWMTGDPKYLERAERIGDAYCLEVLPKNGGLPAHRWDFIKHEPINDVFSLNDHGNEIVGGLSELLVASKFSGSKKYDVYAKALKTMYDRLLEKGRNPDGIWYGTLKASTGEPIAQEPPDTWGYALTGVATYGIVTGDRSMETAVLKALHNIDQPKYLNWPGGADSFADSIEGGLLLLNRYPTEEGFRWLEKVLPLFLARQQEDGVVEGWYGDGNYARTALMAGLYFTQGTMCRPWRDDLRFGAVRNGDELRVEVSAGKVWRGKLSFDTERHKRSLRLPINYPRLNEWPEWFTVDPGRTYRLTIDGRERSVSGSELISGIELQVARPVSIRVNDER